MTDPNNISFIPKEPYSLTQKSAYLYPRRHHGGRRYVRFLASSGCESMSGTSFARYIFQIDYWKKYQQWIPDDLF